jgi:NTE family protein
LESQTRIALEEFGIRRLSIAGTSADAATATMLAGLEVPAEAESKEALPVLASMPMANFVDGNSRVRRFVDGVIRRLGPWQLG